MLLLDVLYIAVLIIVNAAVFYLVLLTCCSWFYRPKVDYFAPLLRLAVIIPAHNEEQSITKTLDAVKAADYPPELLSIVVVADNCSDGTAALSRSAGVMAVQRTDPENPGKGQALDWFLKHHPAMYSNADGVVFLDADSIPGRSMFRELSASLSHPGVQVVQAFNGVENAGRNWRTALNTVSFNIFNHLRMAGSGMLFGSAILKGLGMAFRSSVLEKNGWPAHSVVEDLEFSMLLCREKIPVHYNPYAVVTSEMAVTGQQAGGQRMRWEGGRFKLAARLLPGLVAELAAGRLRYLHIALDLMVPPLTILVVMQVLLLALAALFYPNLAVLCILSIGGTGYYVFSAQLQRRLSLRLWLYLTAAPLFIAWKLLVYLKMVCGQVPNEWKRTIRVDER